MKTIMITAPSSGSGKTMVTMGLIRALKKRGYKLSCFITGPDYIDTALLAAAAGNEVGNLNLHLQGRVGMKQAFSLADGDLCVVEGAMNYFDGIYNTYEGSSYAVSKELDINTLLVYTPQGEMFTAIPKIKGVILNRVTMPTYELLKEQIEKHTPLAVLGFVPKMEDLELKSRHLGLVQSMEIDSLDELIDRMAQAIDAGVDLDAIINLMSDVTGLPFPDPAKRRITVAVARDRAFSFYYRENLRFFETACEVQYFSPLTDSQLPDCDLLYLGGGYPEVFRDQLAANRLMLASIKDYADRGAAFTPSAVA